MAKAIDLVLAYNAIKHAKFLEFIKERGVTLANPVPPCDGDVIAIEVEVSTPEKTAPSNVEQNCNHGVALNVVAVLPKEVKKTLAALRAALDLELHSRVVVVDALQLLHWFEPKQRAADTKSD